MKSAASTIIGRLSSYERWQKYCTYFGAGLAGLVVVADFTASSFDTWLWSRPLFITLIIFSAIFLGRAYVDYVAAAHRLQALKDDTGAVAVPEEDRDFSYPNVAFASALVGFFIGGLGLALLLVVAWQYPQTLG